MAKPKASAVRGVRISSPRCLFPSHSFELLCEILVLSRVGTSTHLRENSIDARQQRAAQPRWIPHRRRRPFLAPHPRGRRTQLDPQAIPWGACQAALQTGLWAARRAHALMKGNIQPQQIRRQQTSSMHEVPIAVANAVCVCAERGAGGGGWVRRNPCLVSSSPAEASRVLLFVTACRRTTPAADCRVVSAGNGKCDWKPVLGY